MKIQIHVCWNVYKYNLAVNKVIAWASYPVYKVMYKILEGLSLNF